MTASDEIKAGMRQWLQDSGEKVQFEERWGRQVPAVYGWQDSDAHYHIHPNPRVDKQEPCRWVIPEGAVVVEETYSQFVGTYATNQQEVGLNVAGVSCACGKYTDVTLRIVATLGEAIQALLGYDPNKRLEL